MAWLQIGSTSLNLDRVKRVQDLSTKDSTGQVVSGPVRVFFDGGDHLDLTNGAEALRSWLSTNAQGLQG